jgi:hypothetical protein
MTPHGNDHQNQRTLNAIGTYWSREEVSEAFNASKGKDAPWAFFRWVLEAMASGEWNDRGSGSSDKVKPGGRDFQADGSTRKAQEQVEIGTADDMDELFDQHGVQ